MTSELNTRFLEISQKKYLIQTLLNIARFCFYCCFRLALLRQPQRYSSSLHSFGNIEGRKIWNLLRFHEWDHEF